MKNVRTGALLALIPALAVMGALGCGGSDKTGEAPKAGGDTGKPVAHDSNKPSSSGGKLVEVASKGTGTLKGKVTFEGDVPPVKDIAIPDTVKEKDHCLKGDVRVQTWKIGPDKGVANVVVWLKAPKGEYFKIPDDLKKPAKVKMDQPFCAFEPHVMVLFPTYFDGKKQVPTGQELEVDNSAPFLHNTNWSSSDELVIPGANSALTSKSSKVIPSIKANKRDTQVGGEQTIKFTCNVHPWMNAHAKVFDHPFAAVSSGDAKGAKDFGNYEIKEAPAGAEVELVYWHESMEAPKVFKKITLKEGENTESISMK